MKRETKKELRLIGESIDEFQGSIRDRIRVIEPDMDTTEYINISTTIYEAMSNIRKAIDKARQT